MIEIEEIKVKQCDLESKIKVENHEIQEQQCESPPESFDETPEKVFNFVQYEITEINENDAGSSKVSEFKCIYCDRFFQYNHTLLRHIKRLHRGFPTEYTGGSIQCQLCRKVCEEMESLKGHVEKDHPDEEEKQRFECDQCGKKYEFSYLLTHHMSSHGSERPFACSTCPKTFKSKTMLKEHSASHTTIYKCEVCDKTFESRSGLYVHNVAKHINPTFTCPICSKVFTLKDHLKTHMRVHSDLRRFECHLCNKKFRWSCNLKRHLQLHENGTKKFNCDVCNKAFMHEYQLKRHLEIQKMEENLMYVNGEKIQVEESRFCAGHTCPFCKKTFTQKASRNKHIRCVHKATASMKCHLCSTNFTERNSLLRHLMKIHKMEKDTAVASMRQDEGISSQCNEKSEQDVEESLETIIVKTEYEIN
ncbi:hypothetical protein DMENIID0001_157050 [Sergentomyia squamirostris]